MAEGGAPAAPNDVQAVLDKVWDDLLDFMEPDPVLDLLQKTNIFRRRTLRDVKEQSKTTTAKSQTLLEHIREKGRLAFDNFKQCLRDSGQELLVELLEASEKDEDLSNIRKELQTQEGQSSDEIKLFRDLKDDLLAHYKQTEFTIPVAPLAEKHETELVNFYVRPPMMAYKKPNAFGQKKQSEEDSKTPVHSYRELLCKESDPYKNIYVTADAGMGKTSFSKMLALTWCQTHKPDTSISEKVLTITKTLQEATGGPLQRKHVGNEPTYVDYEKFSEDLKTMKEFDFLFLIHLRKYQGKNICSLDDMVFDLLQSKMARASRYSKMFLEQVLTEKRCLIVVDGLDEWTHPSSCNRGEVRPHFKNYKGCSVLTTTRPWKLSTAGLGTAEIDRHVEISQLDDKTAKKLTFLAIKFLNEKRGDEKIIDDFETAVSDPHLGDIRYVPYVRLQLICLWFEGKPLGKSLCEVYSNMIELILTRWLKKTDSGHQNCTCEAPESDITCLKSNKHCRHYFPLLLYIGKLAFFTLFSEAKEETLIFSSERVTKSLETAETDICLKTRLLSQVEDSVAISSVCFNYYFPHKSLQEFFAAFYITLHLEENIKESILRVCVSLQDILDMSRVFVFVCGMNPELFSRLSRDLQAVVDREQPVIDYRSSVLEHSSSGYQGVRFYQLMQVACLQESARNENDQCDIFIYDIVVDSTQTNAGPELPALFQRSSRTMKSLHVDGLSTILWNIDFSACQALETCNVHSFVDDFNCILVILNASLLTLKCLRLDNYYGESIAVITKMAKLQELHIDLIYETHDNIKCLDEYINGCATLRLLHLDNIQCITHGFSVQCFTLDLSTLNGLQYLHMGSEVNIHTHVNSIDINSPVEVILNLSNMNLLWHLDLHTKACIRDICLNTENIKQCYLDLSLKHYTIQKLYDLIGNMKKLTDLDICISCDDHSNKCPGCKLNLVQQNQLKQIKLGLGSGKTACSEIHVNKDHLQECYINADTMCAQSLLCILIDLNGAPLLTTLRLSLIRDAPNRIEIPNLPELKEFALNDSALGDRVLTFSPEMTRLQYIYLSQTTMSMSSLNELFISISNLPQAIRVMLEKMTMETSEWRELLDFLGKIPKPMHVVFQACKGPSDDEWLQIQHDIRSSPVLWYIPGAVAQPYNYGGLNSFAVRTCIL